VRLFVALEIPDEVRRAIGEMIARLRDVAHGARWVRAEGVHVTLKFIGEMPAERVVAIEQALRGARGAGVIASVEAKFRGAGFFPNERHPRVFWASVEASPNLAELAREVDARLSSLGIAAETREFRPHLTLARFKSEDGLPRLREEIKKLEPVDFGSMETSEFHLFQSQLGAGGAKYTKLATFPFGSLHGDA
jgi:RNA 2',3'-cyclic 3'-phosphodiesterase